VRQVGKKHRDTVGYCHILDEWIRHWKLAGYTELDKMCSE